MNKQKLVRFIDKYYLKGLIQSVVFNSNSKQQKLDTRFVSDDKTLLGLVEMVPYQMIYTFIGILISISYFKTQKKIK